MASKKKQTKVLVQKRVDTMFKPQPRCETESNIEVPSSHKPKPPKKHENPDFPVSFETFFDNTNIREFAIEEIKYNRPNNFEEFLSDYWIKKMSRKLYICYYTLKQNREMKPLFYLKISPQCPPETREAITSFPMLETQKKALKAYISKQIVDSTKAIQSHIDRFPVTFSTFKKYTRWEEILDVIVDYYTGGDMDKFTAIREDKGKCEQIIHNYYYCYYTRPEVRKEFDIRLKAMPLQWKEKLLYEPTKAELGIGEGSAKGGSLLKENESNKHSPGDSESDAPNVTTPKRSHPQASPKSQAKVIDDDLHDPRYIESKNIVETSQLSETAMQKFPVTLKQFQKSTAWQETVKNIVSMYTRFEPAKHDELANNEAECQRILRNLYYHFYTRPEIRDIFPLPLKPMPTHARAKLLSIPVLAEEDPQNCIADDDAASTMSCETSSSVYVTAPSSQLNDQRDAPMEMASADANEALATFGNEPRQSPRKRQSSEADAAVDRQLSDDAQRVQIQSVQILVPQKDVAATTTSTAAAKPSGQVASPQQLTVQTPGFLLNRETQERGEYAKTPDRQLIEADATGAATNKSPSESGEDEDDEDEEDEGEDGDDVLVLDEDLIRQWESEEPEKLEDCPHLWPSIMTFTKDYQHAENWPNLFKDKIEPNAQETLRKDANHNDCAPAALPAAIAPTLSAEATSNQMDATSNQMDATSNQMDATSSQMDATSSQMDATSSQMGATSSQMNIASNQMDATSNQMDATSNQMDATSSQMDIASNQMDATSNQMDATSSQIASNQMDATNNQMDATSSQMDATSNQMDVTSSQMDATNSQMGATPSHFVSFANTQMQIAALPGESIPPGDPLVSSQLQNANVSGNPISDDLSATPIKEEKAEKVLKNMKFVLNESDDTFVCVPIEQSEEFISILDESREGMDLTGALMEVPSTLNNI